MALDTRLPLAAQSADLLGAVRQGQQIGKSFQDARRTKQAFPLLQQQREQAIAQGAQNLATGELRQEEAGINIENARQNQAVFRANVLNKAVDVLGGIPLAGRAQVLTTQLIPKFKELGWSDAEISGLVEGVDLTDAGLTQVKAGLAPLLEVEAQEEARSKFIGTPNRITRGEGEDKQSFLVGLQQNPDGSFSKAEVAIDGDFVSTQGETGQEETDRKVAGAGKTSAQNAAVRQGEKAFEQVEGIRQKIGIYDEVIGLIESGAETGAIASRMPSIRAASIALDNAQQRLGLNVISNTTFGALSEGELKLALNTGLPKNLDGPDLIEWVQAKKTAQQKLMNYTQEAANALASGNHTISSYLELQEARAINRDNQPAQVTEQVSTPEGDVTQTTTAQPSAPQVINFDAQGNPI
jgi:hypothetical protein